MIFSVGLGIVLPACATGALARYPRSAGSASAVIGCTQMTVGVAATASLAACDPTTAVPMASLFAVLTLLGVASCRLTRSTRDA
jgi:DHA1 family bicyclomycin/chloramphenicol resistance-like MFS transporter